jgi:hypothetical protein
MTGPDAELHFFEWSFDLKRVTGYVVGDRKNRFEDGARITTSEIVRNDAGIIQTKNSIYRLVPRDETLRAAKSAPAMLAALKLQAALWRDGHKPDAELRAASNAVIAAITKAEGRS